MTENEPLGGQERVAENTNPAATQAVVADRIAKKGLSHVEKTAKKLRRLEVEFVSIDDVKPNTYNPNRQDAQTIELLRRSMLEDGFTQPIIVHRESKQIVDGEHRWRVARSLDMTQIPVVWVEMTEEQMRISTLRHNRARGTEDVELSMEILRDLQDLGAIDWAQDSLMLTDKELNDLVDDIPAPQALAGDEFSEAWVPERGDHVQQAMAEGGVGTTLVERREEGREGVNAVAMTRDAAEQVIQRKEALERAESEADRSRISHALEQPYRLQFVFTGPEADLVKATLGAEPAEKLLEICGDEEEKVLAAEATEAQTEDE